MEKKTQKPNQSVIRGTRSKHSFCNSALSYTQDTLPLPRRPAQSLNKVSRLDSRTTHFPLVYSPGSTAATPPAQLVCASKQKLLLWPTNLAEKHQLQPTSSYRFQLVQEIRDLSWGMMCLLGCPPNRHTLLLHS